MVMRFFIGLDLGTPGLPTAVAVLDRPRLKPGDSPGLRPTYGLRHLHRFPPSTPYPTVVDEVVGLLTALPGAWLLADHTGVGRPVIELLRDAFRGRVTCTFSPAALTAGGGVGTGPEGGFIIPKGDLVGTLQVLLQTRRLHIASALPDAATLVQELEAYRPRVSLTPDAAAWRETPHEDLVLAAALAAWAGERSITQVLASRT